MAMDSSLAINGSFGKMYHDGEWLTNVQSAEASGEIEMQELKLAGTRVVKHKAMSITYSGTMTGYKITAKLAKKIAQVKETDKGSFVTELVMKLDDPDNKSGKVWVRLKGVQFSTIPILKYEVGSLVMEETPFVFTGYEYI